MKRLLLCMVLFTAVATEAHATCHVALYQMVETEWWDGVKSSHYEFAGWAEVASGATDFGTVGPPAAGPAGGSNAITNLIQNKQNQYETYDCEVPDFDVFVTAQMYNGATRPITTRLPDCQVEMRWPSFPTNCDSGSINS